MELKRLLFCLLLAGVSCCVSCMSVAEVEELSWGEWGECSKPCEGGTQSRHVVCDEGLEPSLCRYLKKFIARKQMKEERPCNTQSCTGTWGDWTDWQPCSSTCGSSAYQLKKRSCYHDNNIQDSWKCSGLAFQSRPCEGLPPCPTDGSGDNVQGVQHLQEPSYSSFQSYDKVSEVEDPSSESSWES